MRLFRIALAALMLALLVAGPTAARADSLDRIARDYVRLILEIGERDTGYVDAYYGPAGWRRAAHAHPRTLDELAAAAETMRRRLEAIPARARSLEGRRRTSCAAQLDRRQPTPPSGPGRHPELRRGGPRHLRGRSPIAAARALRPHSSPGSSGWCRARGRSPDRVDAFQDRFVIPPDRLEAVMRAAIAECRRRTLAHIPLPRGEAFTLEFVTHQSWSGYNWYQGHYRSLIQVNTDFPVRMSRAIDLGCHEGYPGHHVYNMLLERILARGRNWVEFTVYPLYSPQSFIAEGSANYGIELAFPGEERLEFERRVLYPLAGIPSPKGPTPISSFRRRSARWAGARFTIASDLIDGRITRDQAIALTQRYGLVSRPRAEQVVAFTEHYRAYVINYGLGRDMVAAAIERAGADPAARWAAMRRMLSEPTLPADLGH